MSEYDDKDSPRRKRRTHEHVIEDLSENHLERKVLLKGHVLRRPERDYGVDVIMFHFAGDGAIENGIETFRNMSLQIVKKLRNYGGFPDVPRKPK